MICVDPAGTIRFLNRQSELLFGYDHAERPWMKLSLRTPPVRPNDLRDRPGVRRLRACLISRSRTHAPGGSSWTGAQSRC
ncbi:hypothetical protein [Pengzhenrongella sp.]|uniref:hypothetical protein n=1 Tax=Pengzhenrongella sp. TaxID=2888820 RepID=UPI0039C97503